jgi:hypothetical protein
MRITKSRGYVHYVRWPGDPCLGRGGGGGGAEPPSGGTGSSGPAWRGDGGGEGRKV